MMYSVSSFVLFFSPLLSKIRSIHCPCRWVLLLLCLEKLHNALALTSHWLSGLESCCDGIDLPLRGPTLEKNKKKQKKHFDSIVTFHVISTVMHSILQLNIIRNVNIEEIYDQEVYLRYH